MNIVLEAPKFIPTNRPSLRGLWMLFNQMIEKTRETIQKLKAWQQEVMNSPQEIKSEDRFVQELLDFKKELFELQALLNNLFWVTKIVFVFKINKLRHLLREGVEETNTLITFIKERNADFSPRVGGSFKDFDSFWASLNDETTK